MKIFLFLLVFSLQGFAQQPQQYDVVIIGGGPAGLSAGVICQEIGFRTCIFDKEPSEPVQPIETKDQKVQEQDTVPPAPAQTNTQTFQKPGEASSSWTSVQKSLKAFFVKSGGVFIEKKVTSTSQERRLFKVAYDRELCFSQTLIIATGRHPRKRMLIKDDYGRVLHRLWNEKAFSPKDSVLVLGQGQPLFTQTIRAITATKNIFLFSTSTNPTDVQNLTAAFPSITVLNNTAISHIYSSKDSITLQYIVNGTKAYKKASYIILADAWEPSSELVETMCDLDSSKNIITANDTLETSVPGIFACGEVTNNAFHTWIQSAAEGQTAGWSAVKYLIERGVAPMEQARP